MHAIRWFLAGVVLLAGVALPGAAQKAPPGFTVLFNGKDLDHWRLPKEEKEHWKLKDEMIDYDGLSQAKTDKNLWTRKSYRDFVLLVEWRLKGEPGYTHRVPKLNRDGTPYKDSLGREVTFEIDNDIQSGILLRGKEKNEVNISKWPIGSGQIGGYHREAKLAPEILSAYTPKEKADNPPGEWNTFEITVNGDRLTVKLNGKEIIPDAPLPEVSAREGPIGLQHAGKYNARYRRWESPPSLIQFRNIFIKELK